MCSCIILLKGRGYTMKLNAEVLYQALQEKFSVEMSGSPERSLHLGPPELYTGGNIEFHKNHLYVLQAETLPQRPKLYASTVFICLGTSMRLNHYKENSTVLCVKDQVELLSVYIAVQEVYNRFEAWSDKLFELFQGDADMQQYLDVSQPVFQCPMSVLNANFGTIAATVPRDIEVGELWKKNEKEISQESMEQFLEESTLALDAHGAIHLDVKYSKPLAVNLFDTSDKYIGCLWLDHSEVGDRPDHDALAEYLAAILQKVVQRTPSLMVSTHGSVRQVLHNLLDGLPVNPNQRWLLSAFGTGTSYACVSFHVLTAHSQMPLPYICNMVEQNFSNSVAFPLGNTAVAFLNLTEFLDEEGNYEQALSEKLKPMLYAMKLDCGISNRFMDLNDAALFHRQAEIAFENGSIAMPHLVYYYFSSFALMEMVSNSLGGLPAETYYPEGMKKILEHDAGSDISYLETLRVFLEENMNYSSAARLLYVHRSTLIDRIRRIEAEAGIDLSDPNERLQLMLLIKAMELEEVIQAQ